MSERKNNRVQDNNYGKMLKKKFIRFMVVLNYKMVGIILIIGII